jgi:hypothetical protein
VIPSTAKALRAASGTSVSPLDQLLNENRPAKKPNAFRSLAGSENRIFIMATPVIS